MHGLTPNVSTYTIQIGDPSSVFATTSEVKLPSDVMLKSDDGLKYSMVGHVHDVSYSGETAEGGQVVPTGTVSKPSITANNTMGTISYLINCSAGITSTSTASGGNVLNAWTYDAATEKISFSQAILGVQVSKTTSSFTAVTNVAPELSLAPVFTGNALPAHTHGITIKTYTSEDIEPNQIIYTSGDGQPISVKAKMGVLGADSLTYANVNPVISNESISGNAYMLTCAKPITLVGAVYDASDNLTECGPVFSACGDEEETLNTQLTSLTMPSSVTKIGKTTFNDNNMLTNISFIGTSEQWNNIEKEEGYNSGCGQITVTTTDSSVIIPPISEGPADNEIWYTTIDGQIYDISIAMNNFKEAMELESFGNTVISNSFDGNKWIIKFTEDVSCMGMIESVAYPVFADLESEEFLNVNNIILPNSLITISTISIYGTKCTSITLPDNIETVMSSGICANPYCQEITMNSNLITLNVGAFAQNEDIRQINIPASVQTIGRSAFSRAYIKRSDLVNNSQCTNVDEWDITFIDGNTNGICTVDNKIVHIYNDIQNASINEGIMALDNVNGLSLQTIVLPTTITEIDQCFAGCDLLTSLTVKAINPPTLIEKGSHMNDNCLIYVPASSINAYKVANEWSYYADRIYAIPTE